MFDTCGSLHSSEHSLCSESDSPGSSEEMSGLRSRLTSLVDPAVSEFCIRFNKDLYDNPSLMKCNTTFASFYPPRINGGRDELPSNVCMLNSSAVVSCSLAVLCSSSTCGDEVENKIFIDDQL